MAAINKELGLPEQPLAEAVAQANELVGLQPQGSLLDQVASLLHELGLHPQPPPAAATAARPAAAAVQTSTAQPNFFERLQEQKRKDGVL